MTGRGGGGKRRPPFPTPDFDLALTLDSGQTFHWESLGKGFVGTIDERAVYLEQRGARLAVSAGAAKICAQYFALDHPLAEICAALPNDPAMQSAAAFCRGLRIMRQPKWECLATFICSSMKQVAHIRQMSRALRERFGRKLTLDGNNLYDWRERRKRNCAPAGSVIARRICSRPLSARPAAR